jgi:hypothetical protein
MAQRRRFGTLVATHLPVGRMDDPVWRHLLWQSHLWPALAENPSVRATTALSTRLVEVMLREAAVNVSGTEGDVVAGIAAAVTIPSLDLDAVEAAVQRARLQSRALVALLAHPALRQRPGVRAACRADGSFQVLQHLLADVEADDRGEILDELVRRHAGATLRALESSPERFAGLPAEHFAPLFLLPTQDDRLRAARVLGRMGLTPPPRPTV